MRRFSTWMFVVVAALGFGAGCSAEPKDPFDDWAGGSKYENFVPTTAKIVANGTGELTYKAPEMGTLYLVDTTKTVNVEGFTKPTVLITALLPAGTEVIFNPNEQRVRVKGRP